MLRRLWHFTKRFRWPLIATLLTVVLLGYVLQPRPEVEYRLVETPSKTIPDSSIETVQVSPSGKYVLLVGYEETMLQLYQLKEMKLISNHFPKYARQYGFNIDDELVFYSSEDDSFWCWKPGQAEPQKVATHKVCGLESEPRNTHEGNERFHHLNLSRACLLSPDARTWLIAIGMKEDRHFVLIDARTGQERARLQLDENQKKKMHRVPLEAIFSPDSKVLLAQTQEPNRPDDETREDIDLIWFDVQTGKKIRNKQLSYTLRMGDIGLFQNDRVFGISENEGHYCLQTYSETQGYRLFSLSETIADPMEQAWPKASDGIWRAHTEVRHRFDPDSITMVFCWSHQLFPKEGALGGRAPSIPGFFYGVRDLGSCKLIHLERLPDRPRKPDDWDPEGWTMLNVLPHSVLVLLQQNQESSWQLKWESWRKQYFSWFPAMARSRNTVHFIEATTGKRLAELSLPFMDMTHLYNKQENAFYLMGHIDDQVVLQKYAYPLHKPWLLILAWSLGVFVVLASMQFIVHRLRHRKPNAI